MRRRLGWRRRRDFDRRLVDLDEQPLPRLLAQGDAQLAPPGAAEDRAVSAAEADDLLRDAETFLSLAEDALGVTVQPVLPLRSVG